MSPRRLISAVSILLTLSFLIGIPAWADSNVRIVRLSLVDGPVQLDRATGEGFERAIMNMPIAQGMQLWTRGDSRAEVEFENGNTIRLAPETKIEFTQLVLREDGSRQTVVRVDSGRAYVSYTRNSGEDFRIQFGSREVALDRSVHFRLDVLDDRAEAAVFNGDLDLPNLRVKKNNTVAMDLTGGGAFQLVRGINAALEDGWDGYRLDYHDKYAKAAYKGSSFYGNSDLNYYGAWMSSPYGSCWRPYGFDASWSPYSSGAWAWYPGYGYSWVSLYPWGWQPYRTGAWYFNGGSGYCWTPNYGYPYGRRYGYGWAPVYNAPVTYVPVQPPSNGVTRTPGPRGPGLGLVPVGGVSTSGNWKPTDPITLDRGGRGSRGGTPTVVSGSAGGGTSVSTGVTGISPTPGTRNPRDSRVFTPDLNSHHQANRGDMPANMRPDRGSRENHSYGPAPRQDRSFDRGPQPNHNFDASRSSAPMGGGGGRMSAPAPAPSAPAPSAPAPSHSGGGGGGSRGAVPK